MSGKAFEGGGHELPGLDGLRAVAVLLVLLFHQGALGFGWIGVQIFFVLSGFLITRLLYRDREASFGQYLRGFYGRRALRIFPVYYAVLAAFAALALSRARLPGLREGLPYAATYTYNFWYATQATTFSEWITHFWTLCVEEQFYLVWPLIIYACPERWLRGLFLAFVAAGPLLRLAGAWAIRAPGASHLWDWHVALYVLTTSHLDAFAIGAFTSLFGLGGSRRALFAALAVLAVAGAAVMHFAHAPWESAGYPFGLRFGFAFIWGFSLLNVASAFLIDCLAHRRFLPRLFESPPLAYLGKISYGFYVFHYPIQSLVDSRFPDASLSFRLAVQVPVTLSVASASFYLWEARFLRLKDRWFPARAARTVVPESCATAQETYRLG